MYYPATCKSNNISINMEPVNMETIITITTTTTTTTTTTVEYHDQTTDNLDLEVL